MMLAMIRKRTRALRWIAMMTIGITGCASLPEPIPLDREIALRDRAIEAVKRAVRFRPSGTVRALGIEVMERHLGQDALPWVRVALHDDQPGVQFAALMVLGSLRDQHSQKSIESFTDHNDEALRLAAYFALHSLNDTRFSTKLPEFLLDHPSPNVRRNTAMIIAELGEPGAVKLLARAMQDEDEDVRAQALQSMAILGSTDAIQQLTFSASSGMGARRIAAINTLGELDMPTLKQTFQYKLASGEYLETRLAAARALGRIGSNEGFSLALESLRFNTPLRDKNQDPPREQIRRVRQLAALALGAIGDKRALPALEKALNDPADPRIQIVAADAILQILGSDTGPMSRRTARRPPT